MKILVTGRAIPTQPDRCTGQQLVQGFREADMMLTSMVASMDNLLVF